MRHALLVVALLAVIVPAAAARSAARIWIADEHPLVVRGTGFAAHDRVTVRAAKGGTVLRRAVIASAAGAFRAAWSRALPGGCASTKIVATGTSGRRATYTVVVDDCAPPTK